MDISHVKYLTDSWLPLCILLPVLYEDMKTKMFDPSPCLVMAGMNLCCRIWFGHHDLLQIGIEMLLGVWPGVVLGMLSVITGKWVGEGDCLLLILIGGFKGWRFVLSMLFFSFSEIFIAAIVLMGMKQFHRKRTMPMVPFLITGYLLAQWYMFGWR